MILFDLTVHLGFGTRQLQDLCNVENVFSKAPPCQCTGRPEELSGVGVSSIYSDLRQLFWSPCSLQKVFIESLFMPFLE